MGESGETRLLRVGLRGLGLDPGERDRSALLQSGSQKGGDGRLGTASRDRRASAVASSGSVRLLLKFVRALRQSDSAQLQVYREALT